MYYVTFIFPGAVNLTREEFTSRRAAAIISDVGCTGTEDKLTDCLYSAWPGCGELSDAGVVCQSKKCVYSLLP